LFLIVMARSFKLKLLLWDYIRIFVTKKDEIKDDAFDSCGHAFINMNGERGQCAGV